MQLPKAQQAVWKAITEHVRREGALPAPQALSERFGTHITTVSQHLRALETKGLLEIESRGVGRSPILRLTLHGRALAGLLGLPVLGSIPAGALSEAIQHPIGFLPNIRQPGWFGLRVSGESMAHEIRDRDIVILQSEAEPRQGQVCAVRVDDDQSTLKYLSWRAGKARLRPHNPDYPTLIVPLERVRVDGVFRGLLRGEIAQAWMEESPV